MPWPAPSRPVEEPGAPQGDIRPEDVRGQLQRILASATFADSERLRALLRYLVEQELCGAGETLKEFVIGVDVLGKPDSFDPKADSVVRVQASRLRAKLKLYYETEGSADSLRIGLPVRSYRPILERQSAKAAASRLKRLAPMKGWRRSAVAAFVLLVVTAAAWRIARLQTTPASHPWRRITFDTGSTCCPAVSRDGRLIAYASDRTGGDYDIYVQPADGSSPLRLTRHEARDYNPDISPDGTKVVFASYRDGGGIYVVSVLGGEETRIIDDGDYPRFSPDGAWIAFDREYPDGSYAIFVAPAAGGPPRRMTEESLVRGRFPIWSPDGRYLVFVGASREKPDEYDFWAIPAGGGQPIRIGISEALERQGLHRIQRFQMPHDWLEHQVVFTYWGGRGTSNLWSIPLSTRTWKVTGAAGQLTSGGGRENYARVVATGSGKQTLVFSSGDRPSHLWRLPVNSDRGLVNGPAVQLTHDISMTPSLNGTRPSVSADGSALVYASRRWGTDDIWYQNVATGEEKPLASSHLDETDPVVLQDGSAVAFARREAARQAIVIASTGGGSARTVCEDCGAPADWSADGRYIVYISPAEELGLLDLTSGQKRRLPSPHPVLSATFSPDSRWLALTVSIGRKDRGFLVPFAAGRWPPEQEWTKLTDLEATAFAWSPDGRMVYFPSIQDQYRCLWGQRLDPANGKPIGQAFAVKHFHTMQGYPQMVRSVAVGRDCIVLRLTHEKVNIWTMEVP